MGKGRVVVYCKVTGGIVSIWVTFGCGSGLIVLRVQSSCLMVMIAVEQDNKSFQLSYHKP